jgi:2-polyprenyl-3-methyl-5-hydroxy-6-metoxy-1,4-benzoquinol methylase
VSIRGILPASLPDPLYWLCEQVQPWFREVAQSIRRFSGSVQVSSVSCESMEFQVQNVETQGMGSPVIGSRDVIHVESMSSQGTNSAIRARNRFGSQAAAQKYAGALRETATHRREERCIRKALAGLRAGARVLDIPSGTSRLLPLLREMGFRVVEADSSPHMIEEGRRYAEDRGLSDGTEFRVEDALATRFADDAFDAVLCNRLFHHFEEPEVRERCLRELSRICRGPLVVSFFCNLSLDAVSSYLRDSWRRKTATDRIPISRGEFVAAATAAGLKAVRMMMARPGISRQWYVVLERRGDDHDAWQHRRESSRRSDPVS